MNEGEYPGDVEYATAFERILLPIASSYKPELVLISGGFDSAEGDHEGQCRVTPSGYAHMTRCLQEMSDGKVILVLEGGYNVPSVKWSFGACVGTLLGAPVDNNFQGQCTEVASRDIEATVSALKPFWPSLI